MIDEFEIGVFLKKRIIIYIIKIQSKNPTFHSQMDSSLRKTTFRISNKNPPSTHFCMKELNTESKNESFSVYNNYEKSTKR